MNIVTGTCRVMRVFTCLALFYFNLAPEVLEALNNVGLLAGGYGPECDFWSLGVVRD